MGRGNDAPGERARVYGKIAPLILAFAREHAGARFHVLWLEDHEPQLVDAALNIQQRGEHDPDGSPDDPGPWRSKEGRAHEL